MQTRRGAQALPDNKAKHEDQADRCDITKLFAHHGINKISMGIRQRRLDLAFTRSDAEQTASADCLRGFVDLIRVILAREEKRVHPEAHMRQRRIEQPGQSRPATGKHGSPAPRQA